MCASSLLSSHRKYPGEHFDTVVLGADEASKEVKSVLLLYEFKLKHDAKTAADNYTKD